MLANPVAPQGDHCQLPLVAVQLKKETNTSPKFATSEIPLNVLLYERH